MEIPRQGDAWKKVTGPMPLTRKALLHPLFGCAGAQRFSVGNFMQGIRKVVDEFLREMEICRTVND